MLNDGTFFAKYIEDYLITKGMEKTEIIVLKEKLCL